VDKTCLKCKDPVCSTCTKDYRMCGGCEGKICEDCREKAAIWECSGCEKTFCENGCGGISEETCAVQDECDGEPLCSDCAVGGCEIAECGGILGGGFTGKDCCWPRCKIYGLNCETCAEGIQGHMPTDITVDFDRKFLERCGCTKHKQKLYYQR
jgi:hypothetical protein